MALYRLGQGKTIRNEDSGESAFPEAHRKPERPSVRGDRDTVVWDLKDQRGAPVGWGNFICRMSVGGRDGASQLIMLPKPA